MALITGAIKTDPILTNFDARGNKSGDADYGKYGNDIEVFAEAQTNGDTNILNNKGLVLATVKKGGVFEASSSLDATKDKQLILNLEANKSSYVKAAAEKVKDTLPSGTSVDDINNHFGATPLSSSTGPLNLTPVSINAVQLAKGTRQLFDPDLSYPSKRNGKQDHIKFTTYVYQPIKLDPTKPTSPKRSKSTPTGSITLPIQPSRSKSTRLNSSHIQKSRMPSSA